MLSRTADNLYWLSRYVERAEYLVRILDAMCFRNEFVQQFQLLGLQRGREDMYARDVAARAVEAGNQPKLDRVTAGNKDNRDRRSRLLGC